MNENSEQPEPAESAGDRDDAGDAAADVSAADPDPGSDDSPSPGQQLRDRLSSIAGQGSEVVACEQIDGRWVAVIRLADTPQDGGLAAIDALTDHASNESIDLLPIVYTAKDWKGLGELGSRIPLDRQALVELVASQARGQLPSRQLRRQLLARLARYRLIAEHELRHPEFPPHIALSIALTMVEDVFAVLFALEGRVFNGQPADLQRIAEEPVSPLTADDLRLFFRLRSLAERNRIDSWSPAREPLLDHGLIEQLRPLFERARAHALDRLSSDKEKKVRYWFTRVGLGIGAFAVLAIALWLYIQLRPMSAVDSKLASKPGGIEVTYFKDKDLKSAVKTQFTWGPYINTLGAPTQGVGRDHFSVRWKGYVYFDKSARTQLCIEKDDGGRVYLHNKLVIDEWKGEKRHVCTYVRVAKGWHPLTAEFREGTGRAVFKMTRGDKKRTIPAKHFCCKK